MPSYDYLCDSCGPFTAMRPMAEYDQPHDCPECGTAAARALLRVPAFAGMDAGRRTAMSVNERSAHEPRKSSAHGPGCGCCGPRKPSARTAVSPSGAKAFPAARPWMISH